MATLYLEFNSKVSSGYKVATRSRLRMTSTSDTVTEHVATVSYDGGGWTIPYLIGMTAHLQRAVRDFAEDAEDAEATHPPRVVLRFAGVSSGACVALAAALKENKTLLKLALNGKCIEAH